MHKNKVAVVAHDAGAANLLLHYCANTYDHNQLYFSLSGPALELGQIIFPHLKNLDLVTCLDNAFILLSGTVTPVTMSILLVAGI